MDRELAGKDRSRRTFLGQALAGATVLTFAPPLCLQRHLEPVRFGMCADVHKDVMHDANKRLTTFVKAMTDKKADFLVQMGDFCQPIDKNKSFMEVWRSFKGPTYDVIGNHDMDGGKTREQTRAFMGMKRGYYTFVKKGYRFIVLDGNDTHEGAPTGYARHVDDAQRGWLKKQLETTTEPVVILCHQSLENSSGVDNGAAVRAILEAENERAGWGRILACFSGHHHLDDLVRIKEIPYVQVNSMSYFWVGGARKHKSYPAEVHAAHPWIEYTSPYQDPLWAFVTIDPKGVLRIEGVRSKWVGPSPKQLGYAARANEKGITPTVTDHSVKIAGTDRR
ncbi:MAG: metallophosphoesterase [Planctomycetes bacterium]|nr:metallophosphoesterase [Planctomycetota bacterium]